jgi:hypothetical protein
LNNKTTYCITHHGAFIKEILADDFKETFVFRDRLKFYSEETTLEMLDYLKKTSGDGNALQVFKIEEL